jgi:uncharacterized protein
LVTAFAEVGLTSPSPQNLLVEISLEVVAIMMVAACAAGFVDAVVGGGGLIQLPALLLGVPAATPVQILATNKLASIMGTSVSALTYRRTLGRALTQGPVLVVAAFCGSLVGAYLARFITRGVFEPLVVIALVLVFCVVWFRPQLGVQALAHDDAGSPKPTTRWVAVAGLGLGVGAYDGALGPGTGTFFVLGLVMLLQVDFVGASATAKLANWATNLAALLVFVPSGAVLWQLGLLMGIGNIVGGYCGARLAVKRGAGFVRGFLLIVVVALIARLSWSMLT